MEVPELRWETSVFQDPDGGSAILWPYLPCVRMPMKMRPREWDALALLSSSNELISLREEEEQGETGPVKFSFLLLLEVEMKLHDGEYNEDY